MRERPWQDDVGRQVRTLAIIVAALVSGPLTFLAVVLVIRGGDKAPQGGMPWFTYTALAVAGVCVLMRLTIPPGIVAGARRKILSGQYNPAARVTGPHRRQLEAFFARTGDAGRLIIVYMTTTILGAATLEGAVLLLLIAHLIDGQVVTLACAAGILLALAAHFPWRARVFLWIEGQLRRLDEERQFNRPRD